MKKIAFFLNNNTLPDMDYSLVTKGNPGIGGSEYEFLIVSTYLDQRDNNLDVYLFVNFKGKFPHKNIVQVERLEDCCEYCKKNNIKDIVLDIKSFDCNILDGHADSLNVYIWAHNYASYKVLNLYDKLPYIKKIINVGREQMDLYRDHMAILKSTYIYNVTPIYEKAFYESKIKNRYNNNVVYMGSLVPVKGFHVLAKAWKQVVKEVPDAQLYVIGSGKLYDKNSSLGEYGIAEQSYEDSFIKYLKDRDGHLLPSVHFLGLLGTEKWAVLGKCKVGVPNPTGDSETFCNCGIEMQLMGCNIVTIKHPAYLDTIMNKNYLFKHEGQLAEYIVQRLKGRPDNFDSLYNFVSKKFSVEKIIQKWESMFFNNEQIVEPASENDYHCKRLKNCLFWLKYRIPVFRTLPTIESFVNFYKYHILQLFMLSR